MSNAVLLFTAAGAAAIVAAWVRPRVPILSDLEPRLTDLGLLAFLLAATCAAAAALNGGWTVPPEGRLMDAFRFEAGCGIFLLTMAALLPLSGFHGRARRVWISLFVLNGLYFVGVETVQAIRGIDPRFTRAGSELDRLAGITFGVSAFLFTLLTALLLARFFSRRVMPDRPALRSAIRFGAAAIGGSFAVGVAMTVLQGRMLGEAGNLMPLHAAGLHGIQVLPLAVILAHRARWSGAARLRLARAAGTAWLTMCAALLATALAGAPAATPSPWTALAVASAVAVLGLTAAAALAWLRAARSRVAG